MSFLQNLPYITSNDTLDMQLFVEQLRVQAQSVTDQVLAQRTITSYIEQATEPNQAQWETQWTTDGNTLPIPPTAILIWKNTSTGVIGGLYGTTPLSSTVVKREPQYPRGGSIIVPPATLSAAVSTSPTPTIGVTNSNHPSATFVLPVVCDLILEYELHTVLSSGTGTWGADFLLDGEKVGTKYYSLPSNVGLINISATGMLRIKAIVANVAAGSHTVQAIFGVTGSPASPPTIAYGGIGSGAGQYGLRTLSIRAVVK